MITETQRGFTLLEVLVALAVLAVALGALVAASARHVENTAYLRDKTLAHWVAMNRYTEMQVYREWPGAGAQEGTARMAGRDWYWTVVASETPDPELRKVDIQVRARPEAAESLTVLTGYLGLPLE